MVIQWSNPQVTERLFIAMLASLDNKINIPEVARLYGDPMTYHALENQLRKWKKDATAMRTAASGREIIGKSPSKPRSKKGEPSPVKNGVKGARVTKSKTNTPTKIKTESIIIEDDDDEELKEYFKFDGDTEEFFV